MGAACPGYVPKQQDQLNPADAFGSQNCLCYAGAIGGDDHTCGKIVPTGKRVRILTGDTVGGTTLPQVDDALRRGWGIDLDVRLHLTRPVFWQRIRNGAGGVIYIDYSPLLGTRYAGSTVFGGTHGIYIAKADANLALKFDPLCDGRRGLANDAPHGTWTPISLIDRAMDALRDDHGRVIGVQSGIHYTWVGFTRDNEPDYNVLVPAGRAYGMYSLDSRGRISGRNVRRAGAPIGGLCSAPQRRLVSPKAVGIYAKTHSISTVRVTQGPLKGKLINAQFTVEA